MFTGITKGLKEMKSLRIPTTENVGHILVRGPKGKVNIQNLEIYNRSNKLIAKLDKPPCDNEPFHRWDLEPEEEVLGIYGSVSDQFAVSCVGLIVWKPPRI
jgi:hypothetical protein